MQDARKANGWQDFGVVVAIGFFALAAQTLLFRVFLTVFEGNELGIACFFSSWLLWVVVGAVLARLSRRVMDVLSDRFEFLPLLYLPAYLLQWYLLSHARELAGVRPFELFPLLTMLPGAFLANAPVSFCTGMLFTLACRWLRTADDSSVAKVYIWESVGGVLGGLAVTLLLARGVAEETAFIYMALPLTVMFAVCRLRKRSYLTAVLPVLAVAVALGTGVAGRWEHRNNLRTWQRVLPEQDCLGSFTTPEAKYLYGEYGDQFNVVAWETVSDTIPATEHASEIVAIHLAQRPAARRFLVAGRGAFSICRRLLVLPQTETITWFDTDPAYPARLLSKLPARFLPGVERLETPMDDIRHYLGQTRAQYDAIILDFPDATTLALNRHFTREFFQMLKARLGDAGVVGVRISAGENFMSEDRVNPGASVFATLRSVFPHVVIKPGDESWLMASAGSGLTTAPAALRDRFAAIPGADRLYPADGLMALYLPQRMAYETQCFEAAARNTPNDMLLNTDRSPRVLLHSLLFAAHEAGGALSLGNGIRAFALHGLLVLPVGLLLFPLLRATFLVRSRGSRSPSGGVPVPTFDSYALVFTTGAAGMGSSIALMYLYQSSFGSIFLHIGLISALFMLGLTVGSAGSARLLAGLALRGEALVKRSSGLLCLAILAHVLLFGAILFLAGNLSLVAFAAVFVVNGLLNGVYVPLAACRLNAAGITHPAAGARIEALDHLGGALGGLVTGLVLLPLFGTSYALLVLALLLLTNVAAMLPPSTKDVPGADRFRERIRSVGYVLFGLAVFAMEAGLLLHRGRADEVRQAFLEFARSAADGRELHARQRVMGEGRIMDYFCATNTQEAGAAAAERYFFQTDTLSPDVVGYGGPITLAVALDGDGTLRDVRVLQSDETPSYLDFLGIWIQRLTGHNLFAPDPLKDVDAVTGATLTSSAILRILRKAVPDFARTVLGAEVGTTAPNVAPPTFYRETLWLALAAAAALFLRVRPSRWLRRGLLVLVVVLSGFVLNMQYSLAHVFSLFEFRIPPFGWGAAFALIVGVPMLVTLFGNVYCGYLCPFGALQELVGDLRPASLRSDPDKTFWAYGRFVKYLLLALMTLLFATTLESALASSDPLVTVFAHERSRLLLCMAGMFLGLAFFYPRFWCRTLCPTGAFLSLLNGIRLLGRLAPPVVPAACVYGVRDGRDLDCLCCDRCRRPEIREEQVRIRPSDRASAWYVNAVLLVAAIALALTIAGRTATAWRRDTGTRGHAETVGRGVRTVDMERLLRLIEQRRLSGQEARFYKADPGGQPRSAP